MHLDDISEGIEALLQDTSEAINLIKTSGNYSSNFYRRILVKTFFSSLEGIIWLIKQQCLKIEPINPNNNLSISEICMLNDVDFRLEENGLIKESFKAINVNKNLRFAITTYNKLLNTKIDIREGTTSWKEFGELIKVRNRITHPRKKEDLLLSDLEMEAFSRVVSWLRIFIGDLLHSMLDNTSHFKNV